ncbi:MAG TPA: hypothetical protein DDW52_23805 [Planctomycetaceae bacterium]|nr:hypothetical protein [Planctomycetaceae bacterium]
MQTTKAALVVDDSRSMRRMVSAALAESGFDIIEGANGAEALHKAAGRAVSIVITDFNMPVMNGLSLIRELRALPEHRFTPILMLTTESKDSMKAAGRAAGATGWITKPFKPQQLIQVVNKVVG